MPRYIISSSRTIMRRPNLLSSANVVFITQKVSGSTGSRNYSYRLPPFLSLSCSTVGEGPFELADTRPPKRGWHQTSPNPHLPSGTGRLPGAARSLPRWICHHSQHWAENSERATGLLCFCVVAFLVRVGAPSLCGAGAGSKAGRSKHRGQETLGYGIRPFVLLYGLPSLSELSV